MKRMLANFGNEILSKNELKNVKGGWCYSATCSCGGGTFAVPPGDLNNYRAVVSFYCSSGNPVNCSNYTPCGIQ